MSLLYREVQDTQVIIVLNGANAIWSRCGGPNMKSGLTSDVLLSELVATWPDAGWDEDTLSVVLHFGTKQGRFKSELAQWYLNSAMVLVNWCNIKYADLSRRICIPRLHMIHRPTM